MRAHGRRQFAGSNFIIPLLGLLLAVVTLAGCGANTIRFDREVTSFVAGLDASELERFNVHYQDNYSQAAVPQGPSPSAVLLDVRDDIAFEGDVGWTPAQDEAAARLLSRALESGLRATELRGADENLLGYLVASESWYGERANRYRLVVADDGGSYDVRHSKRYRGGNSPI